MVEGGEGPNIADKIPPERWEALRKAVRKGINLGLDTRERREFVIDAIGIQRKNPEDFPGVTQEQVEQFPSVAKPDLRDESELTIILAKNKFVDVKEGDPNTPVLLEAIHATPPGHDEYTKPVASRVADKLGATLITSKKSRRFSDMNRRWFWPWISKKDQTKTKFYPRSARAALYWTVRDILRTQGRLDTEEKVASPYYRFSIHGMADNTNGFDFAIASHGEPAESAQIEQFVDLLNAEIESADLKLPDGSSPKAIVAQRGDKNSKDYSGPLSLVDFRHEPDKLENRQHPAFGENFQSFQVEISSRLRKDIDMRDKLAGVLANAIRKLANQNYHGKTQLEGNQA